MHRIAIITDVHANLPALEAVLPAIDELGCDEIVHTGDAIGIGPFPAETMELLLNTPNMHFVQGNHDAWFAGGLPERCPDWMSEGELAHHHWVHGQLHPDLRQVVAQWPLQLHEAFGRLNVLFTHYAHPDGRGGYASILKEPSPSDLDDLFGDTKAELVFYGHHHPMSDLAGHARYVNPGSLGCHDSPKSRFAVLTLEQEPGYTLSFHDIVYDPSLLLRELDVRDVPERDFLRKAFFRFTA